MINFRNVALLCLFFVAQTFFQLAPEPTFSSSVVSDKKESIQILFINSYDRDSVWTKSIEDSFMHTLESQGQSAHYYFEYLSTKKFNTPQYFEEFKHLLSAKYKNTVIDYIVVTDDDAALFIADYLNVIFQRDIPVIYCGINQYYQFPNDMYGVHEPSDAISTIKLIRKFHGERARILILTDQTKSSDSVLRVNHLRNLVRVSPYLTLMESNHVSHIRSKLQTNSYDAVLFLLFNRDSNGNAYTYTEGFDCFKDVIHAPVYSTWNFYFPQGIVGGYITTGALQGSEAAAILIKLNRLSPSQSKDIFKHVQVETPLILDYNALKKYGIHKRLIPTEGTIINQPENYFYKNRLLLAIAASIILFLIAIIYAMGKIIRRKVDELTKANQSILEARRRQTMLNVAVSLSHELNTDIGNAITLNSLSERKIKSLESITQGAQLKKSQLLEFINDLQDINHEVEQNLNKSAMYIKNIKEKSQRFEQEDEVTFSLCKHIHAAIAPYKNTLDEKRIALQVSCPIEDLYRGSPQAFEEIISILLDNAIEHGFKNSVSNPLIKLFAHAHQNKLHLRYEDNGCGISVSPIDRIFDPLFKGNLSTQGEGMGLFRARQLSNEVFQSDLSCESTPGEGVVFKIEPKSIKIRERGDAYEEN